MVFELMGTAHAVRVLANLERQDGAARFTPLREGSGISDQQLTRALRYLNRNGYVASEVLIDEARRPVEYRLTRLGADALETLRIVHGAVHARNSPTAADADQALEAVLA